MSDTNRRHPLIIYGHHFCPQALALKSALDKYRAEYEWRDVLRGDARFRVELAQLARGYLSVPTVVFPDGTVMVEPWPDSVLDKLNIQRPGLLEQLSSLFRKD
ncbi:MAG: glutaredoxin [Chloroflexi bacterium]|nr:glutaredoxin [Chloroflexota bacterium]